LEEYKILIVEDESLAAKAIKTVFSKKGYKIKIASTGEEALKLFLKEQFDLILLDYKLPGMNGEEVFDEIIKINPFVPIIFMTAYGDIDKAVRLLKKGAFYYIPKPIEIEQLSHLIEQAIEKHKIEEENKVLKEKLEEKFSVENYVFNSKKMQSILNLALRVADSETSVLITGESGTGKEVLADIIHSYSKRKDKPFVKVNIAALPSTLVEAELFGAEKGAYTGADRLRKGRFEEANGGTIFLDEIGELPQEIQVKLLRVIQERVITRLGSNIPIPVDIRIITATNKNLEEEVKKGNFREDLLYRLNVITIELPPLRERKEDIPFLIDLFIRKFSERENKEVKGISKTALDLLLKYDYPGNIRELENIIERAVVLTRGSIIGEKDLPMYLNKKISGKIADLDSLPLPERLKEIERNIILTALEENGYVQTKAAKALGISESTLRYKMENLDIKKGDN